MRTESNHALEADTMVTKKPKPTSIQISIETCNRLNRIKGQLEKIVHKQSISYDEVLQVLLTAKPLDVTLDSLILEDAIPQ